MDTDAHGLKIKAKSNLHRVWEYPCLSVVKINLHWRGFEVRRRTAAVQDDDALEMFNQVAVI
jgi:hypothetical protein